MKLEAYFEQLGLRRGDVVLMHSSFKSLGPVEGGIKTLIDAMMNVLTEEGTLLVPTLSYAYVTEDNPVFDVRRTRSNVGAVTNYVWQLPEAHRSLSPTHSVAGIGKYAREITEGQLADDTPVGANSPFRRLPQYGGKILFLGCSPHHNTSMHGVEELVRPEYLFRPQKYPFTVVDQQGCAHDILCCRHNFHRPDRDYAQRYARVIDWLGEDEKSHGKVAEADCWLLDAKAVWREGERALRENPLCLVDVVMKDAAAKQA